MEMGDEFELIGSLIATNELPGVSLISDSDESDYERQPRKPNKPRDFIGAYKRFIRFYFSPTCIYSERDFERRFRLPRSLFENIFKKLEGNGEFKQQRDATGKLGIHPMVRLISVLRIFAYGLSFDEVDELCEISESEARNSFISYISIMPELFEATYLRCPTTSDLKRILAINDRRGFPGCVGSWDCQHWQWKNCPVQLAGQCKGKEKKPTIVLEAICDGELWIWACNYGNPGSMNDINILDASSIVEKVLNGELLPDFQFKVNGKPYSMLYYLVDGIYPNWAMFIDTIAEAINKKEKTFSGAQEAVRKDIERAFGVLLSRWHLLAKPCNYRDRKTINNIMKTAIIMHNMIVELRHDGYESQLFEEAKVAIERGIFLNEEGEEKEFEWSTQEVVNQMESSIIWAQHINKRESRVTDEVMHYALKGDLVEHIWARNGML